MVIVKKQWSNLIELNIIRKVWKTLWCGHLSLKAPGIRSL